MFTNLFFENRSVYEIMSKNVVEPVEPQTTSQYGAHALQGYMHARACTRLRARAPTRQYARTHTQKYVATMICERVSVLRYILNSYYASVFSCGRNIPNIKSAHSGEIFIINTKLVRKWVAAIGRSKSVGPDSIPGEILKLGEEAMIPYLARLLEITLNNAAISSDWKKAIVVPI